MTLVKGRMNTNKINRIGRKLEIKTKTTLTAAIIPIYEMFLTGVSLFFKKFIQQ